MDNSLNSDPDISKTIDKYKNIVQEKYLDNFGMKFDEVLANSSFNFVSTPEIGKRHAEELYHVVVGLYSAQMLSVVGDKSLGLLSIVPKTLLL
jgi:hypothetical protein